MGYKKGEDREQMALPMCLDDYVRPDSMCRVIAAFVYSLDLTDMGFKYAEPKDSGRPPYSPANMMMLYIYGYLNRVRSSRRLEAETHRNVEVMWLMEKLTPDDKTISNFRKDNAKALRGVFRAFSLWCAKQGLFGGELAAVDGTKIRANSSWKNIYTVASAKNSIEKIDNKISKYLAELDENDNTEEPKPDAETITKALKRLTEKKESLESILTELEMGEISEISTVDPDARIMRQGGDGRAQDACYNVRAVVDAKNKLIVDFENSTCANDIGSLSSPASSAKDIMSVSEIAVVADTGFYDGADFERCSDNGITCYVAKRKRGSQAPSQEYARHNFKYDKESDTYICPMGTVLPYKYNKSKSAPSVRIYGNITACKACPKRDQCTTDKRGWRQIIRGLHQDAEDEVDTRMASAFGRHIMGKRKEIVEHPFGTVKKTWGFGSFLCRGIEKTTAEVSLAFLAYNLRRVYNIFAENKDNLLIMIQ